MRALLIGGTGFISSHVARQLISAGNDVTIFHRGKAPASPGVRHVLGDRRHLINYAEQLRAARPDIVIDFLLSSGRQAREVIDVLQGCAKRIVAVSSCDVYRACGILHGTERGEFQPLPLTESSELRTNLQTYGPDALRRAQQVFPWIDDEYDKIPVEREILGHRELPGTVLRLPMVYGPEDPLHRFKSVLARMEADSKVMLMEQRLAAWRSPRGYVENVARAIALAATSDDAAAKVYNVAESDSFSEREWAAQIAEAIGWRGRIKTVPFGRAPEDARMPGNFDQHWIVDSTRIRVELGYREPVHRREAILRTINWERGLR